MLTRRTFLGAAGATAVAVVGGVYGWKQAARRGVRFAVPAPEQDDLKPFGHDQTFPWAQSAPVRSLSDVAPEFRSLLTIVDDDGHAAESIRRAFVPGLLHSAAFAGDNVLVVTRGPATAFYAVDARTMEIVARAMPPAGFIFGGHVAGLGDGLYAVTLNSTEMGHYDAVGIYDGATLKLVRTIGSYGFQAHELALSGDGKTVYVGHYGSNFRSGPYKALPESPLYYKVRFQPTFDPKGTIYPGSVAAVDLATGKFLFRQSNDLNGPQGHLAVGHDAQIFLPKLPALLTSRPDAMTNPLFLEGAGPRPEAGDFMPGSVITGTTIVTDHKHSQYLLSNDGPRHVVYGSFDKPEETTIIKLAELGNHGISHGITLHPDGKHYVVSCENGFLTFERGTHRLVRERTFETAVGAHSHFAVG